MFIGQQNAHHGRGIEHLVHSRGPGLPGQNNVDWTIRLNGLIVTPTLYLASDIDDGDGSWAPNLDGLSVGSLSLQAGAPTYNKRSPFCAGSGDDAGVDPAGSAYWKATSGPTLGTQDLIVALAMLWKADAADQIYVGTRVSTGGDGWQIYCAGSSSTVGLLVQQGAWPNYRAVQSPALVDGQVVIFVACVNRDEDSANGMEAFGNAIAGGSPANPYILVSSISDGGALTIGAFGNNGANKAASGTHIYAGALWQAADIFSAGAAGAAEMLALAKRFTYQLSGLWNLKGPSDASKIPTVTRATVGAHEVERSGVRKLWWLGAGLAIADDAGVWITDDVENIQAYSYDLTNWTTNSQCSTALDADDGPDGEANKGSTITEDGVNAIHYCEHWVGIPLAGKYEVLVLIKNLTTGRNWIRIAIRNILGMNYGYYYFDYLNGAVGSTAVANDTVSNPVVEDWGGGLYALRFFITTAATEPRYMRLMLATADAGAAYLGDGRKVCEVYHAQMAAGHWRHPLVRTNGAAATQNAIDIDYPIAAVPIDGPFTIEFPFTIPNHTPDAGRVLMSLSDGGSTSHAIIPWIKTNGKLYIESAELGGDSGSIDLGAVCDGDEHIVRFAHDGVSKLYGQVDGGVVGVDTTATMPTGIDTFRIGRMSNYANGHIAVDRMKIWKGIRL